MNYIREINAFYDWLETNVLSLSAVALWHALMHINNKAAWTDEFAVAISVLCVKTGLSPRGVTAARNELKLKSRIEWHSRKGSQSATYRIISLVGNLPAINADIHTNNCADNHTDNSADNRATLNKLDETKQDDINLFTDPVLENERHLLHALKTIPKYPFDYDTDMAFIQTLLVEFPTVNLYDQIKAWATWLLDNPLKKNSNPRSRLRNWCKNSVSWEGNKNKNNKVVKMDASRYKRDDYTG